MANPIKDTYPESNNNYGFAASGETFVEDPSYDEVNAAKGLRGYQNTTGYYKTAYVLPYEEVLKTVSAAEADLYSTISKMEDNLLRKIYLNPYADLDLELCHVKVWQEASANMDIPKSSDDLVSVPENGEIVAKDNVPSYICFDEYLYAEKSETTACKRFISEYTDLISHSTFSYLFQIRKLLKYMLNEITCIKESLLIDIGGEYNNESQQKIAIQYEGWAKKAIHYSKRVSKTVGSRAEEIPQSEMDFISKSQAAKLQAFFAIRLNAVDSELEDLLSSLKRDLVDNCDVFYHKFLSPAMVMTKDIASPLLLDFQTTSLRSTSPMLAAEISFASNIIQGNFVSVHSDYVERHESLSAKADLFFNLILEKKKYSAYITQLSNIAVNKKKILKNVQEDVYSRLFKKVYVDSTPTINLTSNHSLLDGLDQNDHPQYLLKDGDTIEGSIAVNEGVTIDGVDLDLHAHTGYDGSKKIRAIDIDYDSGRGSQTGKYVKDAVSLKIERFIESIEDGGIPRFDAVVVIEVLDETLANHEYDLLYSEID